jgi:hypothetical protein
VRIGLGLVRCSLAKSGMIISLRLNIRLILMDRRRLRGSRLRIGVMGWTASTVSTGLCDMQVMVALCRSWWL